VEPGPGNLVTPVTASFSLFANSSLLRTRIRPSSQQGKCLHEFTVNSAGRRLLRAQTRTDRGFPGERANARMPQREPKNIERFLAAVTPKVRSTRLEQLWRFYDVPYGIEVPFFDGTATVGRAAPRRWRSVLLPPLLTARVFCLQPVRIYFVPYLSGMRLVKKRTSSGGGLQRSTSVGGEEMSTDVAFQYYEYERVQDRLPFAMKIQELQQQVRSRGQPRQLLQSASAPLSVAFSTAA
jgi:hypothetical protein